MPAKSRGKMTEEQKEAARLKDRERYLQKKARADMTKEERDAARSKDRERKKARADKMTEEERQAALSRDRERKNAWADMTEEEKNAVRYGERKRRLERAEMTEEEREAARSRDREQKKSRADMTEEERKAARSRERGQKKARADMTEEEREAARSRDRERKKARAKMTKEEKEAVRSRDRERYLQKKAALSELEIQENRSKNAIQMAQKRAALSEEEKIEQRSTNAKRIALFRSIKFDISSTRCNARIAKSQSSAFRNMIEKLENDRTAQRIQGIIWKTLMVTRHRPERYQNALTFINNSMLEIGNLNAEIADLKKLLVKTVSDAVKNAVKMQRIRNQCAEAGVRSLTFVQISLPLEPDVIQHQLSTLENETDPLLLQSGQDGQTGVCSTGDKTNEKNQLGDIPNDIFEVCVHDSPIACEETPMQQQNNSKNFGCSFCSKKFGTSLGLTIHLKEHTADWNECKCSVCPEAFHDYNLMTTHYLQVHTFQTTNEVETEEIDEVTDRFLYEIDYLYFRKCLICFQTLDKSRFGLPFYCKHIISDHSDNKELFKHFTYICSRCDIPHSRMSFLETHWITFCYEKWKTEDESNGQILCLKCGMKFSSDKCLSTHVKTFHEKVTCEQCGVQVENENGLRSHIAGVHKGEYKFTCEQCGKKCKSKHALKTHTKFVHLKEKSFVCKFCSKKFANNSNLETHLNTHTGEKPCKCKICGKSFAAKSTLICHEGVHEGFKCKICQADFGSYMDLCRHRKRNHRGESGINENNSENNERSNCDICGKSFKTYSSLYLHKRYIHGKTKYMCDICGKLYTTPVTLAHHKYTHDDLKRFGCSLCERKFRQKINFYKHKKVAHVNQNARIVKLIFETNVSSRVGLPKSTIESNTNELDALEQSKVGKLSNTMPILLATNTVDTISQLAEDFTISNCNLEQEQAEFSPEPPELDDYSSDREYVNEDNGDEIDLPQIDIAELRNVENEISISVSQNVKDSSLSNYTTFGAAKDHLTVSSYSFIDFSRANVPSGITALSHAECQTEVTKQKLVSGHNTNETDKLQHEVFVEDSENHSYLAKLDVSDLVKLKTEKVAVVDMEYDDENGSNQLSLSDAIRDNENELETKKEEINANDKNAKYPRNICAPGLIVKLTRLLEYQCVPCDKTIFAISQREIRQHSRTHRTDIPRKINLKLKSDKVGRRKIGVLECLYCDKKNLLGTELVEHCSKEHPGKEPLKCKMCPKTFRTLKRFYNHKSEVHTKTVEEQNKAKERRQLKKKSGIVDWNITGVFDCSYCDKKKLTADQMIVHCSEKHPGKEPLKCNICLKMFSTYQILNNHRRLHRQKSQEEKSDDPNAKMECLCEGCGKSFYSPQRLKYHIDLVHNAKRFPCDICSKLIRKDEMESHKRRHLGIKPYLCEECGNGFVTQRELTDHVNVVHKNLKRRDKYRHQHPHKNVPHPFSYKLCPEVFRKESGLTNHLQLHDPERKYSCDECGLRYKFYTNVITHKNYKHKKKGKKCIEVSSTEA